MPSSSLAQDEFIEITLTQRGSSVVAIATGPGVNAGATFVIEATYPPFDPIGLGLFNAVTQEKVPNVVGPNQVAWTDAPCAYSARVRRTDANGGDGTVFIAQQVS